MEREREAQHSGSPDVSGCPAGNPATEGPTAHDQRQVGELSDMQVLGNSTPCGIDLRGRCRRSSPRNSVGLLDQGDREARSKCHLGCQTKVVSGHSPACAVAEHHEPDSSVGRQSEMHPRVAVRGRDE